MATWYHERHSPYERHSHQLREIVYSGRTRYQKVRIADSYMYGRILFLDGDIQSAEADEGTYHETLVHPAMLAHPEPRRVLIMGGGEGATLREVLRHKSVERVVMIDLDGELVELCKKYMPQWSQGTFKDPRLHYEAADARAWVEKSKESFDVVIHDLPQPVLDEAEIPELIRLFSRQCCEAVRKRLSPQGTFSLQSCSAREGTNRVYRAILNTLRKVFPVVAPAHAYIPSFANDWGYSVASLGPDPRKLTPDEVDARLAARVKTKGMKWYHGTTHNALFAFGPGLPSPAPAQAVIQDGKPLPTWK
ncbi:MAG: spermine/spermidine synthase domain-containing protein [Candidatus Xenobia bacterium]